MSTNANYDQEQLDQENALWPWLADDSMADDSQSEQFPGYDDGHYDDDPWYYCEVCATGLVGDEIDGDECPHCGHPFENEGAQL